MHFNDRADLYKTARPPYPAELWHRVRATGLVGPGRRALDLGAGTGEATGPLLAEGMDVVAVEPGRDLAAILAARYPAADLLLSRAEDVELADSSFDLVVAATSIHWMNLDIVLPKVRRALVPEGRLLVWRNVFGDPSGATTAFRAEVARIVSRRPTARAGKREDAAATADMLTRTGLFSVDDVCAYRWSIQLDAEQIHCLFSTFSDWTPREVAEALAACRALGGQVVEHYRSWLIVASPRHGSAR
nr:class I SAM-dependent methyltransferase [Mycobacterium sp.]